MANRHDAIHHQPSERDQAVFFETPDLYHISSDSGELQYKPRELKKAVHFQVLGYTANCYDAVLTTLTLLVMNSTFDEDPNP